MAVTVSNSDHHFSLVKVLALVLIMPSFCNNLCNVAAMDTAGWALAGGTWYGSPVGPGSEGGACGYGNAVSETPFSSMVAAGGPSLFSSGKGCGTCFQVKCTEDTNKACSGNPITVVITDSCPGCTSEPVHFDLSGTAFGAMAKPGQADFLRNAGQLPIQYVRVECNYPGMSIAFRVDSGSNPYYIAFVIEYEDGDGDVGQVSVQESGKRGARWVAMEQSWGAVWRLNPGSGMGGPLSVSLTTIRQRKTVVAQNVIPAGWVPGQTYRSHVNFDI